MKYGPWTMEVRLEEVFVVDRFNRTIAEVYESSTYPDNARMNAQVMAAASELLRALEVAYWSMGRNDEPGSSARVEALKQAKLAIDKATGET